MYSWDYLRGIWFYLEKLMVYKVLYIRVFYSELLELDGCFDHLKQDKCICIKHFGYFKRNCSWSKDCGTVGKGGKVVYSTVLHIKGSNVGHKSWAGIAIIGASRLTGAQGIGHKCRQQSQNECI